MKPVIICLLASMIWISLVSMTPVISSRAAVFKDTTQVPNTLTIIELEKLPKGIYQTWANANKDTIIDFSLDSVMTITVVPPPIHDTIPRVCPPTPVCPPPMPERVGTGMSWSSGLQRWILTYDRGPASTL